MELKFGTLKVTVAVLLIQAIVNGMNLRLSPAIYGTFALFDVVLALMVYRENRTAVKVALVYLALDFFMATFYLIAGALLKGVIAFLDFLALHDMVSYVGRVMKEEGEVEAEEESGDDGGQTL
ncbi:hypothetical protein [Thermococcus sp. Bubb.Bath]|uniref:hypothetical protein n=1 Tax=Thermococcus sp. Bubb.Bath TaxID=1638242 RepID=UPI001439D32A|nr:hypothetical protein [Thermococcus sp. Bubb.Bath]NJF24724.1 hypothetical protein [Thermococcus sp. Bubb.Bath]